MRIPTVTGGRGSVTTPPTRPISKRSVDAIKPDGTDTVYWDGELAGFGLRVRRSGRKVYVVQTRVAGKLRWFTIGAHGPIAPDQARGKALEILALAKKGIDPRDANARGGVEPSVADLGQRFLEEYVPVHCKPSTQEEYRRSVKLFIEPVIRAMRIQKVQRKNIAAFHHGLNEKPYQANRTLGSCRRCSLWPRSGAGGQTVPIRAGM